jgi:hypothetical protein
MIVFATYFFTLASRVAADIENSKFKVYLVLINANYSSFPDPDGAENTINFPFFHWYMNLF